MCIPSTFPFSFLLSQPWVPCSPRASSPSCCGPIHSSSERQGNRLSSSSPFSQCWRAVQHSVSHWWWSRLRCPREEISYPRAPLPPGRRYVESTRQSAIQSLFFLPSSNTYSTCSARCKRDRESAIPVLRWSKGLTRTPLLSSAKNFESKIFFGALARRKIILTLTQIWQAPKLFLQLKPQTHKN